MKVIVISGSYSNIGKTTLARNISAAFASDKVEIIKFGHNMFNPDKQEKLFHDIQEGLNHIETLQNIDYLIIESNSIYKFIKPDLGIFLKNNEKPQKDSALLAEKQADIVIDERFDYIKAKDIINREIGNDFIISALFQQYIYIYLGVKY
ncbi:MAG: hypothetical protein A2287_10860 [Candidatus Melainabacteria bacterium RIFOXYA12_FULL_32_12]|nr:MAG: hypothetical protein A2287_10860 [Candidatus Melainabacteria bacterium RIFOXYA12_FULL_32_12]